VRLSYHAPVRRTTLLCLTLLSADGSMLAVGASGEDSAATGINGVQSDDSAMGAGAVYVFSMTP